MLDATPERIIGDAGTDTGAHEQLAGLHLRRAGVDLTRDVRVVLGRLILDEDAARLPLQWEDARRPKLFPVLEAALEVAPLSREGRPLTRIGLVARYRPPLGSIGALTDTVAGSNVVLDSVKGFLGEVVNRIEAEIAPKEKAS